jgi:putative sporulation protein YyaC
MITRQENKLDLYQVLPAGLKKDHVVFVCIGSDLSIGDSLGPIVGSELEDLGFTVIGTLKYPLHGLNLRDRLKTELALIGDKTVIAIDACIGAKSSVGGFEVRKGPVHPGKGLGKKLMKIGDYSIAGIVSSQSPFDFFHDQVIHLSFVMDMAKVIVADIHEFFSEEIKG